MSILKSKACIKCGSQFVPKRDEDTCTFCDNQEKDNRIERFLKRNNDNKSRILKGGVKNEQSNEYT